MSSLNLAEIRRVNAECNAYKKKASDLMAEREYKKKSLDDLCKTLTEMLGEEVNASNLKEVYDRRNALISNTLQTSQEVLARIKNQEATGDFTSGVNHNAQSGISIQPTNTDGGFNGNPQQAPGYDNPAQTIPAQGYAQPVQQAQPTPPVQNQGYNTQPVQTQGYTAPPVQQAQPIPNQGYNTQPAQNMGQVPQSNAGGEVKLPESDYKLPNEFLNGIGVGAGASTGTGVLPNATPVHTARPSGMSFIPTQRSGINTHSIKNMPTGETTEEEA